MASLHADRLDRHQIHRAIALRDSARTSQADRAGNDGRDRTAPRHARPAPCRGNEAQPVITPISIVVDDRPICPATAPRSCASSGIRAARRNGRVRGNAGRDDGRSACSARIRRPNRTRRRSAARFLPQQAVGADDAAVSGAGERGVEDQQMVAERRRNDRRRALQRLEQVRLAPSSS